MSARSLSASNLSASLSSSNRPVIFVRMDFNSGVSRLHTHIGNLTITHPVFGSETYSGIGDFGGLTKLEEGIDLRPYGTKIGLTGVKSSYIAQARDRDEYHNRDIDVLFGFLNDSGALVDDPDIIFSGLMDKAEVSIGRGMGTIELSVESRASRIEKSSGLIFNDEDQQSLHSGDLFFQFIDQMQDLNLRWGDQTFRPPLGFPTPKRPGDPRDEPGPGPGDVFTP